MLAAHRKARHLHATLADFVRQSELNIRGGGGREGRGRGERVSGREREVPIPTYFLGGRYFSKSHVSPRRQLWSRQC